MGKGFHRAMGECCVSKYRGRVGELPEGDDIFASLGEGGHPKQREQKHGQRQRGQEHGLRRWTRLTHIQGEAVCCSGQCKNQAACP